ncbi:hypothetical protein VNO77_27462 [Canavalia gladiata]|uniref:Uncharacterized protein n=1 Tax=Canavalia gladiata TaxID=3824 RepID=A0AAN9QAI9_CANGL
MESSLENLPDLCFADQSHSLQAEACHYVSSHFSECIMAVKRSSRSVVDLVGAKILSNHVSVIIPVVMNFAY